MRSARPLACGRGPAEATAAADWSVAVTCEPGCCRRVHGREDSGAAAEVHGVPAPRSCRAGTSSRNRVPMSSFGAGENGAVGGDVEVQFGEVFDAAGKRPGGARSLRPGRQRGPGISAGQAAAGRSRKWRSSTAFMPSDMCLTRPPASSTTSGAAYRATAAAISSSSARVLGSCRSTACGAGQEAPGPAATA